jgi:hypothetical protein
LGTDKKVIITPQATLDENTADDDCSEPHWLDKQLLEASLRRTSNESSAGATPEATEAAIIIVDGGDDCIDLDAPELLELFSSAGDYGIKQKEKGKGKEKSDEVIYVFDEDDDSHWSF